MSRPRFSIRTLLVLTALAAAGCYMWIVRPTVVAARFVAAVNIGDFPAAEEMVTKGDGRAAFTLVVGTVEFSQRQAEPTPVLLMLKSRVMERTWRDLVVGRRRIELKAVVYEVDVDVCPGCTGWYYAPQLKMTAGAATVQVDQPGDLHLVDQRRHYQ